MRTIAKKRKLSAYNRHVQKEMKAGKTMKQAAKSWKKKPGSSKKSQKSSPKTTKRRKTSMAKKRKSKRRGFRLPGGLGPKGILMGVLGLTFIPRILPVQSPGAAKLGTGLALRALKVGGGGPLAAVGIMELVAEFLIPMIGGVAGGFGAPRNGGTDY